MTMLSVITLRDLINARVALGTMEMEHLAPVNYHDQYIFHKKKKKQCMYLNSLIFFISLHFKFSFSFFVVLLFLFLLFWGVGELKIVWAAVFELCFVKSHYGSWFR